MLRSCPGRMIVLDFRYIGSVRLSEVIAKCKEVISFTHILTQFITALKLMLINLQFGLPLPMLVMFCLPPVVNKMAAAPSR